MDKQIVLDDGTIVYANGEAKNKADKIYMIEEGEYVTKTGRFFDRTGEAIENAWEKTKEGVKDAAEATKEGLQKAGDAIKKEQKGRR